MHIVTVGATGQVARALLECGSEQGVQVTALGRPRFDLTKRDTLSAVLRSVSPDAIVNAAAYTAVDEAERNRDIAFDVNAVGAAFLARCARELAVPLIHISTDYVFDGEKDDPYTETDALAPLGQYGQSKAAGELAVMEATSDHVILRTSWVFSPFERNFVTTMLRLAKQQDRIRVVSDQYGSPTYAPDLAVGIVSIARNLTDHRGDRKLRGTFHLAGGGFTNWSEFARAIFDYSRSRGGPFAEVAPISTAEYAALAPRPRNSRLDCTKVHRVHGVTMRSWETALQTCISRLLSPNL